MREQFKYGKRQHVDALFDEGTIRIGTLHDYRLDEKGDMVADAKEGIKTVSGTVSYANKEDIWDNEALRSIVHVEGEGVNLNIENLVIKNCNIHYEDYYVFSVAADYSAKMHKLWHEAQAYDCCYRICYPRTFLKAISKRLAGIARFLGCAPVIYYEKGKGIDIYSDLIKQHPALFKAGEDYGAQNEVRAVWQPLNPGPMEPKIIKVPNLGKYCSRHRCIGNR